ncbi:MAG TPA: DegT/DnrJ/EryC1/StrS family aminotransferase [Solirubrobacteraceae bacterium]|nr:DegT/DnrJ/EryC1/StrS family aminotransferase [Solirubrobacteraceae bacterium]
MSIPLLDIHASHRPIRAELDAAIAAVLDHGRFVAGPEVAIFEQQFGAYCGAAECVGSSSGTDALTVGLLAAGIGRGDEVIIPAMTFIATAESVVQTGAVPVFVDCDAATGLMEIARAQDAIGERTAAIVPVHLYGQMVDVDAFEALAASRGLLLVEDAAQAHGAAFGGRRAGSVGAFGAFSFFPGKNLGALGDAGALTTNDGALAGRARKLRDHGRSDKYRHDELGTNARLDTLQAALLSVKLAHLEHWNECRRAHAAAYDAAFADVESVRPVAVAAGALPVYHQYVVRVAERERALQQLAASGIAAGVHYPIPLHRQPALAGAAPLDAFPGADALAAEALSLPVFPELSDEQRDRVTEAVRAHATRASGEVLAQ